MVRFEVNPGDRFEVEFGRIRCLDEADDIALTDAALQGKSFQHEPDPDRAIAQAVIDYWGRGQILEADEPDQADGGLVVY